jgi:mannose-1-phosphate guanylyltransferase/mannose-6-phosphate isomerase
MEKTKRAWGYYIVLDEGLNYKIKDLVVEPNQCLSLQIHEHRHEHWFIKEGRGTVVIDGRAHRAEAGDHFDIFKGEWHQLINGTNKPLVVHEIQYGGKCDEEDIERW